MNGLTVAGAAWIAVGGLIAIGFIFLAAREIPAMRREARILRM